MERVGSPTWKTTGGIVATLMVVMLLVGGTAMAANLGILRTESSRSGHRLNVVPRPALVVTVPADDAVADRGAPIDTGTGRFEDD